MSAPGPTHRTARTRGVLLLVLVLVTGILMGASAMVLVQHFGWGPPPPREIAGPPPRGGGPPPEAALRHLTRALQLDDTQRAEVRRILERRREEIDVLMRGAHAEIRELLGPEQQEKLDALRIRHEGRGRRGGGPPGGGPGRGRHRQDGP